MGESHRFFLIARVIPHGDPQGRAYYRCIGGFHRNCSGHIAVRAVHRVIDLVQNKHNARIIREEIHAIQGIYGRRDEEPTIPKVPCPYSAFLMAAAITTNIENRAWPSVSFESSLRNIALHADMGSTGGEKIEEVTVIDVTDPEKPSYCFVAIDSLDPAECFYEETYNTPSMVPLSATQYARVYHPLPSIEQEYIDEMEEEVVLEAIALLDGVPLVTSDMLFEAWPSEYREPLHEKSEGRPEKSKTIVKPVVTSVPSLIQLIILPAVERGLKLNEMTNIEDIIWMASDIEVIKGIKTIMLLEDPFPDTAIGLLTKIVRTEVDADKVINLSGFHVSPSQIITIVTKQFEDAEVLDLSNIPGLTVDAIFKILPSVPNLRRLVLLGTSITDDEIYDLLPKQAMLFQHLEALIHPCFIRYVEDGYPNAFSIIYQAPLNGYYIGAVSLPCFTPAQALQAITDYISSFVNRGSIYTSSIAAQAVIASEVRRPGQKWSQRSIPLFPQRSLRAFKGEGWFFAFEVTEYCQRSPLPSKYAFVKMDPESNFVKGSLAADKLDSDSEDWGALKVCNLKEFLLNMQEENRPPPPSSAVDNLTHVIEQLGTNGNPTLMTVREAREFITKTISFKKTSYNFRHN